MSKIFISYRRNDSSDITGRIFDHLSLNFNKKYIFKDVNSIPLGSNFKETIEASVQSCEVILVVIGPNWSGTDNPNNRRIDDPNDFVRIEIETCIKRKIPIIPILVSNTEMPNENELPLPLKELAFQNALSIRPDPDFKNDIKKLIVALKKTINPNKIYKNKILIYTSLVIVIALLLYISSKNDYIEIISYLRNQYLEKSLSNDEKNEKEILTHIAEKEKQLNTDKLSKEKLEIVKGFDINGAKLGMTPDQLRNSVNCNYLSREDENKVNKVTSSYFMWCSNKRDSTTYSFDENKKLYYIERHVRYGTGKTPDWESIHKKVVKKYGKPHFKGFYTRLTDNVEKNHSSNCWGECIVKVYKRRNINGSDANTKDQGISFRITYGLGGIRNSKTGETEQHHTLFMALIDSDTWYRIYKKENPPKPKKPDVIKLDDVVL